MDVRRVLKQQQQQAHTAYSPNRLSLLPPCPAPCTAPFDDDSSYSMLDAPLFLLVVLFRCLNSLLVQTFFDPDEYWQSLEVAHHVVFGYAPVGPLDEPGPADLNGDYFRYGALTWEWRAAIRSFLHPSIFAVLYKLLSVLRLDFFPMLV